MLVHRKSLKSRKNLKSNKRTRKNKGTVMRGGSNSIRPKPQTSTNTTNQYTKFMAPVIPSHFSVLAQSHGTSNNYLNFLKGKTTGYTPQQVNPTRTNANKQKSLNYNRYMRQIENEARIKAEQNIAKEKAEAERMKKQEEERQKTKKPGFLGKFSKLFRNSS